MTSTSITPLVLASRSAVRVKLLNDAGIRFATDAADLDEDDLVAGVRHPAEQAALLARAKALHVARRHPGCFVLGGDQVGAGDDDGEQWLLAKPRDPDHHVAMLLRMSGRQHTFHPAVALVKDDVVIAEAADTVTVTFRAFGEDTARAYVASGEGVGCCGGYESEHRGAQLIERVDGSLQAVLGFPLLRVLPLLRRHCPAEAGLLP
ncbi:MAG TPA: Maf family protein [Myxococcota bacterium]